MAALWALTAAVAAHSSSVLQPSSSQHLRAFGLDITESTPWIAGQPPLTPDPTINLADITGAGEGCSPASPGEKMLSKMTVHNTTENPKAIKLLCAVWTYSADHEKCAAVKETWGKRCDKLIYLSNTTEHPGQESGSPSAYLPDAVLINHPGKETYWNMWQKSRWSWMYISQHLHGDFDWFLMGGCDMYVVVDNLKHYLSSPEIEQHGSKPLYLGRRFKLMGHPNAAYNSGGSGYLLNKQGLTIAMQSFHEKKCAEFEESFAEDVIMGDCLAGSGLIPTDTADSSGAERFHVFTPDFLAQGTGMPDWYLQYSFSAPRIGEACCSKESVSFHFCDPPLLRRIDSLLYSCRQQVEMGHKQGNHL